MLLRPSVYNNVGKMSTPLTPCFFHLINGYQWGNLCNKLFSVLTFSVDLEYEKDDS